jgi:hypothetical protein
MPARRLLAGRLLPMRRPYLAVTLLALLLGGCSSGGLDYNARRGECGSATRVSVTVSGATDCSKLEAIVEGDFSANHLTAKSDAPCVFEGKASTIGTHNVFVVRDATAVAVGTGQVSGSEGQHCSGFQLELAMENAAGAAGQGGAASQGGVGGSAGYGGSGIAGSGGGGDPVPTGGYIEMGVWHGYAWTGSESPTEGSTIAPVDFSGLSAGSAPCVSGTVAASPALTAYGRLGVNLNQSREAGVDSELPWLANGVELTWTLHNSGGSAVLLELGDRATGSFWCAPITGESGTTPWSEFTSDCQGGTKAAFDGVSALTYVALRVPSQASTTTPFNLCLDNLAPG